MPVQTYRGLVVAVIWRSDGRILAHWFEERLKKVVGVDPILIWSRILDPWLAVPTASVVVVVVVVVVAVVAVVVVVVVVVVVCCFCCFCCLLLVGR